jgi:hypothetical protein
MAPEGVSFANRLSVETEVLMADTVRSVEYSYVTVPDQPGAVQELFEALQEGGVNLLAVLGFPAGEGQAQIDLVPEDPAALRQAAERAGVTLSERKRAFLIQGEDRVGAMLDVTTKLAKANISITAAAAVSAGTASYGMLLWVAPADLERAAAVLGT